MNQLTNWEKNFQSYLSNVNSSDASHNLGHFKRVWNVALSLSEEDNDLLVILAASYFHDIVSYPKNHPDRSKSSKHAAIRAGEILKQMNFPKEKIPHVQHCIEAHSFSANIMPETIEAKIVQDADRMEALGAIGLARTFYVAGLMGTEALFNDDDLMGEHRELDDKKYAVDHFQTKLLKLPGTMQTPKGKIEAQRRAQILHGFLSDLAREVDPSS